ncbi:MAG: hypothetical protein ACOYLK_17710 [Sphingomonas sp.]
MAQPWACRRLHGHLLRVDGVAPRKRAAGGPAMTAKNKGGRPSHAPTPEQRKQVELMSAYGIKQAEIAGVLGIDRNTLMKHYREELDLGTAKVVAQVANSLVKKALSDRPDAVNAAKFFLERRAGWSETLEHTGTIVHEARVSERAERVRLVRERRKMIEASDEDDGLTH